VSRGIPRTAGWALGDGREYAEPEWDEREAEAVYHLLEDKVVPEFDARDAGGIPRDWVERMSASLALRAPQVSTNRMLREHAERLYPPAAGGFGAGTAKNNHEQRDLRAWT
jgi:starch phosphorylase